MPKASPPGLLSAERQPGLSLPPLASLRLYFWVSAVLGEVTLNLPHFSTKIPTILCVLSFPGKLGHSVTLYHESFCLKDFPDLFSVSVSLCLSVFLLLPPSSFPLPTPAPVASPLLPFLQTLHLPPFGKKSTALTSPEGLGSQVQRQKSSRNARRGEGLPGRREGAPRSGRGSSSLTPQRR